jgi:two-component system, cell cycle sensor histidine kinase and response regulator CckA
MVKNQHIVSHEDKSEYYPENHIVNNNSSMFFSKIVTHDLNNLLTMIFGNISLAKLCINEKDKVIDLLSRVEKSCEHAQYLIHTIVESPNEEISIKKILKLDRLISFTTKLCINDQNIKEEVNFPDDLWSIKADEVQIIQVLMNLLLNSIQAMPNGGLIKIEAENIIIGDSTDRLHKGKYIRLSIQDNGIGIPEENFSKIFDINFTTKKEGKGLGLYIIKDIISKHQGYISVMSKLGKGTTFKIYLPAFIEEN